jgi:hypothetical protein
MSEDAPIRYDVPATLEKWQSLAEKQVWDAGERLPAPRWVEKGWRRQFDDPIVLPNGRKLVTLRMPEATLPSFRKPNMTRQSRKFAALCSPRKYLRSR